MQYREITGLWSARVPDGPDSDQYPDTILLEGNVTFEPEYRVPLVYPGEHIVIEPMRAVIHEGVLYGETLVGDDVVRGPLFLPVTVDENANQTWSWVAKFQGMRLGEYGEEVTLPNVRFQVPAGDDPLDLSAVIPASQSRGTITTRGPRGYAVTSITAGGGELVFEWEDGKTDTIPMPDSVPGPPPTVEWDGPHLVVEGERGPDLRGPNTLPADQAVAGYVVDESSATSGALRDRFLEGRADEDQVALGAEPITSSGWTLGEGWTGTFATGFTHQVGTTGVLEWEPPASPAGQTWVVQWTITAESGVSETARTLVDVYYGGGWAGITYQGLGLVGRYSRAIKATSGGGLRFVPESAFSGRIHDVSIRPVGSPIGPVSVWRDSTGTVTNEARMSGRENFFMGRGAGRYVSQADNPAQFNTIVGNNAGASLVTGFFNSALGERALNQLTTGSRNVAVGYRSLESVQAGDRNVGVGPFAGHQLVNGRRNVMVGVDVLYQTTTASDNIGLGYLAMHAAGEIHQNISLGGYSMGSATGGASYNVAAGYMALRNVTSEHNIGLGQYALLNAGASDRNVAIGRASLISLRTGTGNVAVGDGALAEARTPSGLVAIGRRALASMVDEANLAALGDEAGRYWRGPNNVMVGTRALQGSSGSSGGERNTVLGYQAGYRMGSGSRNTLIGSMAGWSLVDGSDNILIGNAVNTNPAATGNNRLNIGNTIFGDMSQNKIGIGHAAPTARLHLPAGGTGPESAPLKLIPGSGLMATPEPGAFEYSGGTLYFTGGDGIRRAFAFQE